MTTQHYIFLENVRFYSYHGVAPQETAIGFGRFAEVCFQSQVDDKLIADGGLLVGHSVITVETYVFQEDIMLGSHKFYN